MFRTITAKFAGTCKRCRQPIAVGDKIRYGGYGRTYHLAADCPTGHRADVTAADQDDQDDQDDTATPPPSISTKPDPDPVYTFAGSVGYNAPLARQTPPVPITAAPATTPARRFTF